MALAALSAAVLTGSAAAETGGFVAEVQFSQDCTSGLGVGVAYDGAGHLWVSCAESEPDLLRTNVKTGEVEKTYNIERGLGALAYDAKRNALWAGPGIGEKPGIVFIQLDANKEVTESHEAFSVSEIEGSDLDDGLAYDATDDTLYYSPDGSTEIHHYTTSGVLLESRTWDGSECYNSGLAIGGELLFEGSDGCSHVWVVNKTTHQAAFDFSTFTEEDPNHRDEGLSCDPETFRSTNRQVMWSKEAYSPNRAIAFEIPAGTCGAGGKPPSEPTQLTTSLSGGGPSGANITVAAGTAVTDQATLTGADVAGATGSVTYNVYSDAQCTTLAASGGSVAVTGGSVPSSSAVALTTPGTYYWRATYGGDERNGASESSCGSEIETVSAPPATTPAATTVLAAKASVPPKGTASIASVRGCIASSSYVAAVHGSSIARVTFKLDGHTVKTLRKPTSKNTFAARLPVRAGQAHHVTISVVFTSASKTHTATFHRTLARCAARRVLPRFTG